MSLINRLFLRPSPRARDAWMGLGGLLLILAVISFAGASFTFDEERKLLLRPVGFALGLAGALCWVRGSIVPRREREESQQS